MNELKKDILKCIAARYPFSYQDILRLHNQLKSIDVLIKYLDRTLVFNLDLFRHDYLQWQAKRSPIDCGGYQPMSTGGLRGAPPRKP